MSPPRPLSTVATSALSPGERLRIARALALAVAQLHASGRVHGALAPDRVVVTAEGEVLVLPLPPGHEPPLRRAGFDAPEVVRGGPPTRRSDAFSLAALAWLALAGAPPFDGDPLVRLHRALHADPGPLRLAAPAASAEVEEAIAAALDKQPRRRVSAEGLSHALGGAVSATSRRPAAGRVRPILALARAGLSRLARRSIALPRRALPGLGSVLPRLAPLRAAVLARSVEVALVAFALLAASVPFARTDAALAREIGVLLARGDVEAARRRATLAAREHPGDPVVEKLRGDVACARGAADECLRRYRVALAAEAGLRDDPALRRNARRLVRPDEACATRRAAAHLLGQLRDPEALPALEASRRAGGLFAVLCTGDALDRAIAATRAAGR